MIKDEYHSLRCYVERRQLFVRSALDDSNGSEPISPRSRYGMHHSQPALAVAQEDPFVSSPRRHPHRPPWIQVHVPDHDHADRERGPLVTDVAATALVCMSLIAPEPEDRLDTLVAYGHSVGTERRHECRRGTHECAMPLSFPNSAHLHKWWGGRPRPHPAPWPACRWWQAPDSSREERDEGVPRGPGGPPSNYAESAALRKLSGIAHECVRHSITAERLGETRVTGVFKLGKPTGPEIEPLAGMAAPPKQAGISRRKGTVVP